MVNDEKPPIYGLSFSAPEDNEVCCFPRGIRAQHNKHIVYHVFPSPPLMLWSHLCTLGNFSWPCFSFRSAVLLWEIGVFVSVEGNIIGRMCSSVDTCVLHGSAVLCGRCYSCLRQHSNKHREPSYKNVQHDLSLRPFVRTYTCTVYIKYCLPFFL